MTASLLSAELTALMDKMAPAIKAAIVAHSGKITVSANANSDIIKGQPVAVVRANGRLAIADANNYPLAFVVGVAEDSASSGTICNAIVGPVTLADWSAVAGSVALTIGGDYWLAPGGGIISTPPHSSAAITWVGEAVSSTTLLVNPQNPVLQ